MQAQTCQALITASGNTNLCQGDSVQLTATTGQAYLWSNGKTTKSIYAKTNGNYAVTVTDALGCKATAAPITVSVLGAPDAALQDTVNNFMNCTYSLSTANFNLTVENSSKTKATNTQYAIDWGDGSANVYGSNFTTATHTYVLPGSFNLTLTVSNAAGCTSTQKYLVFNGSNPSFGVASQGNTNDCAPATFTFDIINTFGNTPSTVYSFQFDDGTPAMHFTHANLPKTITHTFTKSAMGKPGNAFTLTAFATNPCGTTPATVGGIRISATPKADFLMNPDSIACVNSPVQLTDFSNGGFNANATGTMATGFTRAWIIKPATGWNFTNGTNNASAQPMLNFTQAGNYIIQLIVTPRGSGAKCTADSIAKTLIVKDLPQAAFQVKFPPTNCAPAHVVLQNKFVSPDLTYNWVIFPKQGWSFNTNSDSVSLNPELIFTKAGSYTIKLTSRNYCGQIATSDTTIIIGSTPEVSLPAAQEYCISQTVTFSPANLAHKPSFKTSSPITIYQWNVLGNHNYQFVNGTSVSSQYPEIKFAQPGVYQVILQAANACGFSKPDTQTITINPAPKITVQSSVAAICSGQGSAILTASGANSYKWFPATGLNKTTGNLVSANPTVTTTYNIVGTNALTGCSDTVQYTVVVKPAIPLHIAATRTSICIGQQTTTLTASGAAIYSWSPAAGLNTTSGATVIANPSVTTTYSVTAIDTVAGCTATKTIKIEVLPLPVVNIGNDTTICAAPQGLQLQGFPKGGSWIGQNISTSGFFLGSATGIYNVIYHYTNANGCFASASKKITVVSMPVANAGNDTTFCAQNPSVLLKGLPAGGIWSGSSLVKANGTFTANTPGVYTLTYTYGNGNCQVSDVKVITVNALPAVPVVANQTICPGTAATLTAQSSNAVRYEWYDALTDGNLLYTGPTFTTPVLQTSKTYFVAAYNAQGCETSNRKAVQVTVNPIALAPTVANATICGSGSATLTASGSTGTYQWFDASQNGNLIFTGSTFQTPVLSATTDYYVQAVSAEGCPSFTRTKATVLVLPVLTNNALIGNQIICANEIPTQINGSAPAGGNGTYTFGWEISTDSVNFTSVSGANNTVNFTPTALTQTTWFRRKVTSGPCAEYSQPVKVQVIARPVAAIVTAQTICAGATATLTANGNGLQYQWFNAATGGQPIFSGNTFNTPALQNTTEYFLEAINAQGCHSTVRSKVTINVMPVIANNFISMNQTICAGEIPTSLTGSLPAGGNGAYTYIWESSTDNVTFAPAAGNHLAVNYAPAALTQTTWFRRVVSSGSCQQNNSASVKITVIPGIISNTITTQPQIICAGNTPQIINATQPIGGNGTFTYLWQMSTNGANQGFVPAPNANQNLHYTAPALQQTTWFRRVVFSGNCSQTSAALKVEVNPPLASNTISASQTVYSGSTPALLNGSLPTGGNGNYAYTWEISITGNASGFTGISANSRHFQPGAIAQTTWLRRVVRSGDCELVSNVVQLTVVPAIANNVIQQNQTICQNNAPGLLAGTTPIGGIGNYTYLWEMSTAGANAGFSTAAGIAGQKDYQPGILTQTTWFKRTVISGAYTLESNVVQIIVNPNISNNTVSVAQTICAGSAPAVLLGSAPTGGSGSYTYVWEMSSSGTVNSFVTATGINNGADYQPGTLQQTTWFRRKVSAGYCSDNISAAIEIKVNQIPSPPAIASQDICSGTAAILVLPVQNYNTTESEFEWYETANGGQLIGKGVSFTTPALTKSKTYYVQAVQNSCASTRIAVNVNVREATADAGEDVDVISGKSTALKGQGGVSYKWFPAEGLSNPNIANPVATPDKTSTYTLEVVSESGCVSTDEVTVTVLPKIKIVNTFTPNNDGINDTWEIKGLEEYRNCRIEIFNRWGAKVYESTGYPQPWNGVSQNGEQLPIATYYYIIYLNKTEAPLSGNINIVR
ncbi:gliding motility-associated C-terminal domain-containing protein [Adhaeribacter sp. BT258]|uniref:Gliding motility-associated C-terminal domain-containing protein n=1 Tax=Adhaeribacter terrigena TaxID=2793070 RepID=A0ABS1C0K3_9BACT|nr:gliding motility-associated C-terminal domain-containing protein [Adhaeribacter terrigena]MBK0402939.1 gliding motility-associated C-terminal domain-containing protein [Adhaeribacter terrigena]